MSWCSAKGVLNLSSQQLPENASRESIGRAYHATETFAQSRGADDSSPDAGSFSMGSHSTYGLSVVLQQVDIWLGCAELLQSLLGSGIATSLDDIADQESSGCLMIWNWLLIYGVLVWLEFLHKIVFSLTKGFVTGIMYSFGSDSPGILDLVADKERFRMRAMMEEMRLVRMTMFRRQPCSRYMVYYFMASSNKMQCDVKEEDQEEGLVFVKSQLRQIVKGSDLSNNSERGKDADDSSPDAALVWVIGRADPTSDKEVDEGGCLHSSFGTLVDTSVRLSYSPYLGLDELTQLSTWKMTKRDDYTHLSILWSTPMSCCLIIVNTWCITLQMQGLRLKLLPGQSMDIPLMAKVEDLQAPHDLPWAPLFIMDSRGSRHPALIFQHTNALKTLGENAGTRKMKCNLNTSEAYGSLTEHISERQRLKSGGNKWIKKSILDSSVEKILGLLSNPCESEEEGVHNVVDECLGITEPALVSLCSDELVSVQEALNLSSQQLPENASRETIGHAYHAIETFVQLSPTAEGSDLLSNSGRVRGADDSSPDAGSFSMGSQSTYGLSVVL
ncbi:hypothetical protein Acr_14g0001620 [Actinidia rufa]|uniref:Uncharacterized protein n=1 Tax=Actinidia rufa TaxID=165716 RepID=A0A7J0FQ73_9ERIC|nr:hypothetical protein Acr_14g0001620 [Actinidia rufa]